MTKIVDFENALDDLISEVLTKEDVKELERYYEDTTIISIIKDALQRVGVEDTAEVKKDGS